MGVGRGPGGPPHIAMRFRNRAMDLQLVDALGSRIVGLFTDTKRGKNAVQDIVGGGGAGDGVDWAKSCVEIEQ